MKKIEPTGVYNFKEARDLLGISTNYLRLLLQKGEIKGHKIGKSWKILGSELIKFLERGTETPPPSVKKRK